MQWIETTGRSIEEAKDLALNQLGIAEDDAEFEVIEEPSTGLFGRTRGEARVRARVRPSTPRAKTERRDRRGRDGRSRDGGSREGGGRDGGRDGNGRSRERSGGSRNERGGERRDRPAREDRPREDRPPREKVDVDPALVGQAAADFLGGLVEAFGSKGNVSVSREDDEIEVRVDGTELGLLVGPGGATLLAIQDLARVASQRRLGDQDTRLRIDIAGYRERRREALSRFAQKVAADVIESGSARRLEPMTSADRKVVHDTLAEMDGVVTKSEGEEPRRRVVVEPA